MPDDKEFDDGLLFTTKRFGDIVVKQLSFGELGLISADIVTLYDKVVNVYLPNGSTATQHDLVKIIILIMPDLQPILAKVCGVPLATIQGLTADEGVKICAEVWRMNQDIITNFFGIASSLKLAGKG